MKEGLMWFDNDPKKNLAEKVERGAAFFERKYGAQAKTCHVHTGMGGEEKVNGIRLVADPYILPGHFLFCAQGEVEG